MPVLTALLGQTAPPNPVFPPNNLSDSKGMHVGEGDFVGARWRQVWVSSLSPQLPPPRPGRCAPPSCLVHCSSCCLRKTRLPAELPTSEAAVDHIKKTSLPPRKDSFHQGNHMGSQDLIKPVVILIACSLRGRGEGETSPLWGKEPGYQGHLCMQRPLSRREKHRAAKSCPSSLWLVLGVSRRVDEADGE